MLPSLYRRYRYWRFKNTILMAGCVVLLIVFIDSSFVQSAIQTVGTLGYGGAFISGLLFVSTFTVLPATVLLFHLAQDLNPVLVASCAAGGAVLGDFVLFRFMKNKIFTELKPLFAKIRFLPLQRLFATPFFGWLAPVVGAAIIASPLPDEVGIGLIGISKMKSWQFLLLSFVFNSIGILLVVTLAQFGR